MGDTSVPDRPKDSFFHEFRGTGVPQILLGMAELIIPVLVIWNLDDIARDLGVGLWGSLGLILTFAVASSWRAIRRGRERRRLFRDLRDPVDFAEEVEDHWTDLFRGTALLLVLWAMIPTTRYVMGIDDAFNSALFLVSDAIVGGAAALNLYEGWRRRTRHVQIEEGRFDFTALSPSAPPRDRASDDAG